ncbi:MAG: hypothetical protein LBP35_02580 [Candidatus Ancillula trichonymphae]|nr:hypothetical protein [Candidatus Ancillula trichonymphae]
MLNISENGAAQPIQEDVSGSFGDLEEVPVGAYGGVPYDTTVVKSSHRVATPEAQVDLVEGLTLVVVPVLLLGAFVLGSNFLLPVNVLLGVVFAVSYSNILVVPYKLRIAIVAIICAVITNLLLLTVQEVDFNQKIVGELTTVLLLIFCLAFMSEMLKRDRNMLIKSIANTVSLELFVVLFCGYFLALKLFCGNFAGYVALILAPFVAVGLVYSIIAGVEHFFTRLMTQSVRIRIGVCVYALSVLAFCHTLPLLTSRFIIRTSDIPFALIPGVLALCTTNAQFGEDRSISGALTRALFPICVLGITAYVVCVAV